MQDEVQTSTSDDISQVELVEVKDAPTPTEQANVEVVDEAPAETVTLTKAELQEQKNAASKMAKERSERAHKREIQALRAEFDAVKAPVKEVASDEPNIDDYDDFIKYTKAHIRWDRIQADNEREQESQEEESNQYRSDLQKAFTDKADKFRAVAPDYDDVIADIGNVQLSEAIAISVLESDLAAQITYYFGQNPDELDRINTLSPLATAREIGRLEATLASKPTKTIQTSSAPSPINPVTQSKATITKDPSKMSDEEWYSQEKRAKARK